MSAITVLSQDTARKIGSAQCLADPCSLVKELVENSLDAHANAIFIEISTNTVDRIRVRDDGQGIHPADCALLCQRHCTSKIKSLQDLDKLGGRYMGFRGEALASAAELSSNLILQTRADGEPTATEVNFNSRGDVTSQKRVSHPAGTTIQVDGFLSSVPVRKQSIDKSPSKSLTKIKKTLQAYVLTRPRIRFSLKVLKAKDTHNDWSYAPSKASLEHESFQAARNDTLVKIYGRTVADQCKWISVSTSSSTGTNDLVGITPSQTSRDEEFYRIEGHLISPKSPTPSTAFNLGHCVSVDSRPVSCSRGVLKDVVDQYKSHIRQTLASPNTRVSNPLLVLNILCPQGSYDVNIEPAKDDVLFHETCKVTQLAFKAFNDLYGTLIIAEKATGPATSIAKSNDFQKLLAKKPNLSPSLCGPVARPGVRHEEQLLSLPKSADSTALHLDVNTDLTPPGRRAGDPVISDCTAPEICRSQSPRSPESRARTQNETPNNGMKVGERTHNANESDEDSEDLLSGDRDFLNPWTLAKMNCSFQRSNGMRAAETLEVTVSCLPTPARQRGDMIDQRTDFSEDVSDEELSVSPGFPYPIHGRNAREQLHDNAHSEPLNETLGSSHILKDWLAAAKSPQQPTKMPARPDPSSVQRERIPNRSLYLPISPASSTFPTDRTSEHYITSQTPTRRVSISPKRVLFPSASTSPANSHTPTQHPHFLADDPINADLAATLDYETRKQQAMTAHRAALRKQKAADAPLRRHEERMNTQSTLGLLLPPRENKPNGSPMNNSPHEKRYRKAIAALHNDDHGDHEESPDIAERSRHPSSKQKKTKKHRHDILTFETIGPEDRTIDLVVPIEITLGQLSAMFRKSTQWDTYVREGKIEWNGLGTNHGDNDDENGQQKEEIREWETRLRELVDGMSSFSAAAGTKFDLDLKTALLSARSVALTDEVDE